MKRNLALVLVILCLCLNAGAVSELRFKHVGVKDGLSHSTVNAITQDGNGYLWVATADGLNRYDGERMRVYRDFADGDSLPTANHIKNVEVTSGGDLWAVTEGALWHYDAENDHFVPFRFPGKTFSELLVTDDGAPVYVGTTDGILVFDPATKTFGADRLMPLTGMHSMTMSGDRIFAGTDSGLFEINPATGDQRHIPLNPGLLVVDVISKDGKVYIATEGGGLYIYDTRDGNMRHFSSGDGSGLGSNYVRSLAFDDEVVSGRARSTDSISSTRPRGISARINRTTIPARSPTRRCAPFSATIRAVCGWAHSSAVSTITTVSSTASASSSTIMFGIP